MQLRQVSKSYGAKQVLLDVSFTVNEGEVLGLLGPNGAGKSTLLKIVAGREKADRGKVVLSPSSLRIGYLPQGYANGKGAAAEDVVPQLARQRGLEERISRLAERLAVRDGKEKTAAEYEAALEELRVVTEGCEKFRAMLGTWGLSSLDLTRPMESLSGGEQTKLGISYVMASEPEVLLLDEPTNHLDVESINHLEEWLQEFKGAILIATHDRMMLDRAATSVLDITEEGGGARYFRGTYVAYLETVRRERAELQSAYKQQQREIAQINETIRRLKERGRRLEQETTHHHYRKRAAKITRAAKVQERRLQRSLGSGERVEKPKEGYRLRPLLKSLPRSGEDVLSLEGVSVRVGGRLLLQGVSFRLRYSDRVALLGPNGSGKTALLRVIMEEIPVESGRLRMGAGVVARLLSQGQEDLDGRTSAIETLRGVASMEESELRKFMHSYLFTATDVYLQVSQLSYGQRARLNLARLVLSGVNFLLLDEPTNHLDIPSRESFEAALESFEGTVLVVSHDRFFLETFPSRLLAIEEGNIREYPGLSRVGW